MRDWQKYIVNLLLRALATGVVAGLMPLIAVWQGGANASRAEYLAAVFVAAGAIASVVVSALTAVVGEPYSHTFIE